MAKPHLTTLVAIGDSITAGVGAKWNRGYPTLLAKLFEADNPQIKLVNWGIPGLTIPRLTKALQKGDHLYDKLASADWIVMTIGGNDIINHFPKSFAENAKFSLRAERLARELDLLIATLISLSAAPIYLGDLYNPFPHSEAATRIINAVNNKHLEALARRYKNVTLVKISNVIGGQEEQAIQYYRTGTIQDMRKWFRRPIHPNDHGHQRIAEAFYQAIVGPPKAP